MNVIILKECAAFNPALFHSSCFQSEQTFRSASINGAEMTRWVKRHLAGPWLARQLCPQQRPNRRPVDTVASCHDRSGSALATLLLRSAAKRNLTADQFGVEAAACDERRMYSGFDEATGVEHGDEIGVVHRRQAVGDHDGGAIAH
jgi:hypothetical protein